MTAVEKTQRREDAKVYEWRFEGRFLRAVIDSIGVNPGKSRLIQPNRGYAFHTKTPRHEGWGGGMAFGVRWT